MNEPKNKIEKLIAELCPNGVVFNELRELGEFYGGLSGKSKEDFSNGNAKYVTYMNIFSNIAVNTDIDTLVKADESENQNKIEYGDVLFTGSSETPNECGMSSVLTKKINEPLYLNSFCFGFRFNDASLFLPEFSKYLFRDEQVREQIAKTASGVTRFNVSKKRFAKTKIPLPPLAIQQEIVKILDSFTELEAELEATLEAGLEAIKKQYEHYRASLFLNNKNLEIRTLGEVCHIGSGGTPLKAKKEYWENGDIPWVKSESCRNESIHIANSFITNLGLRNSSAKLLSKETTLIALVGATIFKTAFLEFEASTNQNIASIKSNDSSILSNKFVFYYLTSLYSNLKNNMKDYGMLNLTTLRSFKIPILPIDEQERIVLILDRFDALVNDISVALPAEIKARRYQYEYYRKKLLTFKEYGE